MEKQEITKSPNALIKRPELLSFNSLSEMHESFERIFLGTKGAARNHGSRSGLIITAIDHSFFHMVKMSGADGQQLFMRVEKENIRACTRGLGSYKFHMNDHRAKYLLSALDTLEDPDEVYECENLKTARYSFVKEYDSKPYPFTILLIAARDEKLLVLATSFPCKRSDSKKWRRGKLIYAKNTDAAR